MGPTILLSLKVDDDVQCHECGIDGIDADGLEPPIVEPIMPPDVPVPEPITSGKGLGCKVSVGDKGYIRYFPASNRFEAVCHHDGHKAVRCRLTRYSLASAPGPRYNAASGRPLGLLTAWLMTDFPGLDESTNSTISSFLLQETIESARAPI